MKTKIIKINLGLWQTGSINQKIAAWAKSHNYKISYDSKRYIHIFTPRNEYMIDDVFHKKDGSLLITLKTVQGGNYIGNKK